LQTRSLLTRRTGAAAALAMAAILAVPIAAFATTTDAIAQTGGMTATLPLLGSSLTVQVTLDVNGNVSQVNLDPVGDYTATKLNSHAVTFDSTAGGTQVKIKAHGSSLSIGATAGTLGALVGPGTWSADLFGTGSKSSVDYTVGNNAGAPTITIGTVTPAAGITSVIGTPEAKHSKHFKSEHQDGDQVAIAMVSFTKDGYTKTLSITVKVDTGDKPHASLKLTLTGRDRQVLTGTIAELQGDHTWSGKTCDGTPIGITYTVNADGTVSYVSATGGTVTTHAFDKGFLARFDTTRAFVNVSMHQNEQVAGTYTIKVKFQRYGCGRVTVPDPIVNTTVQPGANQPSHVNSNHNKTKQGGMPGHMQGQRP
jgi:hypothetical protein